MYKNFENSILIVDDLATNRLSDSLIIQTHFPKLTLFQASSGDEALKLMKSHPIDIVLCDVFMPDMDGFELAQKIKSNQSNTETSIIFLTASSESEELKKRGISIGAVDFIRRPYDTNSFVNKIKLYLNLYKKNQELHKQIIDNEASLDLINRYVIASKTDLQGVITEVTDAFCSISGYNRKELIGKPHNLVRHPDMPKATFKDIWHSIKKGKIWSGEVKNRHKDGGFYWVYAVISPMIDSDGQLTGYISTRQDITERKKQQIKLLEKEQALQAEIASREDAEDLVHEIIDNSSDLITVTTLDQPIFFNKAMLKFLNIKNIEAFKASYKDLNDFFMQNPDFIQNIERKENWLDMMHGIDQEVPVPMQALKSDKKGLYNIQIKDLHTHEKRFLFTFSDVTDLEEERQYYEKVATHDNLTGIHNRYFYVNATEREIQLNKRNQRTMSLLLIDIDHFKSVNDTYGHDVGDEVLKKFAQTIKNRLRDSDIFARWGGEEFIVTLPNNSIHDAKIVAESVRKSVEKTIFNDVGKITCSIGVSTLQSDDTLDTLIKRADVGLYKAKESGRNCVWTIDM